MHERDSIIFEEMLRGKLEGSLRKWANNSGSGSRSRSRAPPIPAAAPAPARCAPVRSPLQTKPPDVASGGSGPSDFGGRWDGDARDLGLGMQRSLRRRVEERDGCVCQD